MCFDVNAVGELGVGCVQHGTGGGQVAELREHRYEMVEGIRTPRVARQCEGLLIGLTGSGVVEAHQMSEAEREVRERVSAVEIDGALCSFNGAVAFTCHGDSRQRVETSRIGVGDKVRLDEGDRLRGSKLVYQHLDLHEKVAILTHGRVYRRASARIYAEDSANRLTPDADALVRDDNDGAGIEVGAEVIEVREDERSLSSAAR